MAGDSWRPAAALAVALGCWVAVLWPTPEVPGTATPLDAMAGYLDPPDQDAPPSKGMFSGQLTVAGVVPIGERIVPGVAGPFTVTGRPEPGLPPGADPALAPFDTLRIPVRGETGRSPSGTGQDHLPNLKLIGNGLGRATQLYDPACGGAPDGVPPRFRAPRDGYVCFVVPPGFEARYLVLFADDVAVDLGR